MTTLSIHWQGDGLARISAAVEALAGPKKLAGLARAINHTGDKVHTRVVRRISERTSVAQRDIKKYGSVRISRANGVKLEYVIRSSGHGIPLKVFGARQGKTGVSVMAWGHRYVVKHAFMVTSIGGNVFWREGKARLPIKKLTGASIPKEMVKSYVDEEFQSIVIRELPARVEHEVRVITNGIVS